MSANSVCGCVKRVTVTDQRPMQNKSLLACFVKMGAEETIKDPANSKIAALKGAEIMALPMVLIN
jgi:hypothetical protein